MITVHLKNGQALHFPDGTAPDVMKGAISKRFPDQVDSSMGNIENAVANDVQRINQGQQPTSISNKRPNGPLGYEESPEEIGRNQGNKDYLKSGLPELFVSMLAPELKVAQGLYKIPAAYRALQQSPRIAKGLQTVFGNAIPQAGVSALFNPENPTESAAKTGAITSGLDIALKNMFPNVGKLINGAKQYLPSMLRSNEGITRDIAKKIAPEVTPTALRNFKEGKKLGVHVLPHESADNVKLDAIMKKLGTSPEGARKLQLYQKGKDVDTANAVGKLQNKIFHPEKLGNEMKKAFEDFEKSKLSKEAQGEIFSNGVPKDKNVAEAMDSILEDTVWKESLKHLPEKDKKITGETLMATKEHMDDVLDSLYRNGSKKKAQRYEKSKDKFVETLDLYSPEYEKGRHLYELKKARDTIGALTKSGEPHAEALTDFLKDSDKKEKLVYSLRNLKGGKESIDQLQDVFSRIDRINTNQLSNKINSKLYEEAPTNTTSFIKKMISSIKGGKYDKAAIDLVTSKDWPTIVQELTKTKDNKEYVKKLSKYLVRAVPKRTEKENEPELDIVHKYNQFVPPYEQGAQ